LSQAASLTETVSRSSGTAAAGSANAQAVDAMPPCVSRVRPILRSTREWPVSRPVSKRTVCSPAVDELTVRRARTADVPAIRELIDFYSPERILLDKPTVTLYEDIQEFWVAERDNDASVVGCGALHVMWRDLAEVRTVAVDPRCRGLGIGHAIVEKLLGTAAWLGVRRVFCLTFETAFFERHGFRPLAESPIDPEVTAELLRSADEGIAEFLDLERVKPNTLGNTRMLRLL
jgi:amino-acid N-acetyltransferase